MNSTSRIAWWLEHPTLNEEAKHQAKVEAKGQVSLFGRGA